MHLGNRRFETADGSCHEEALAVRSNIVTPHRIACIVGTFKEQARLTSVQAFRGIDINNPQLHGRSTITLIEQLASTSSPDWRTAAVGRDAYLSTRSRVRLHKHL